MEDSHREEHEQPHEAASHHGEARAQVRDHEDRAAEQEQHLNPGAHERVAHIRNTPERREGEEEKEGNGGQPAQVGPIEVGQDHLQQQIHTERSRVGVHEAPDFRFRRDQHGEGAERVDHPTGEEEEETVLTLAEVQVDADARPQEAHDEQESVAQRDGAHAPAPFSEEMCRSRSTRVPAGGLVAPAGGEPERFCDGDLPAGGRRNRAAGA